jgi:phosphinothricin acetyltransferase
MSIQIRPSRNEDIAAILAIYRPAVTGTTNNFELTPPTLMEMTRRRAKVMAAGHPFLVAEHEERVVGYAYYSAFRPRPAYRFAAENSIYVDPAFFGKGVGSALLKALIEAATEAGMRQMIAIIGDPTVGASVALHRKFDFSDVGLMPGVGFKLGGWRDIAILQRALGDGTETPPPQR